MDPYKHLEDSFKRALTAVVSPEDMEVLKKTASLPWDSNGHPMDIDKLRDDLLTSPLARAALLDILEARRTGEATTIHINAMGHYECPHCGASYDNWLFTPKKGFACATKCGCPSKVFEFSVDFPSGKVVVANDLRQLTNLVGNVGDINTTMGCRDTSLAYARAGLAHAFVGNTCPGVYRMAADKFVIGCKGRGRLPKELQNTRQVAGVCTDLWWYSLMDLEVFRARARRRPGPNEQVIRCEPGRYLFRHLYFRNRNNEGKPEVFTTFRRTGAARPVTDPFADLEYSAEEVLYDSVTHDYYQMFQDNPQGPMLRAIDQLMCTIGNGAEYHPKGWWGFSPVINRANLPKDLALPTLQGPLHWYPFCEYSVIHKVAHRTEKAIHPSFVRLTFLILCHMATKQGVYYSGKDGAKANLAFTASARKLLKVFLKNHTEYQDAPWPQVFLPGAPARLARASEGLLKGASGKIVHYEEAGKTGLSVDGTTHIVDISALEYAADPDQVSPSSP
jgi:hypothetical protein